MDELPAKLIFDELYEVDAEFRAEADKIAKNDDSPFFSRSTVVLPPRNYTGPIPDCPYGVDRRIDAKKFTVDDVLKGNCKILDRFSVFIRYIPVNLANEEFIKQFVGIWGEIVAINFMGPFKVKSSIFRSDSNGARVFDTYAYGAFVKFKDWINAMLSIKMDNELVYPNEWFAKNYKLISRQARKESCFTGKSVESARLQVRIASRTPCSKVSRGVGCSSQLKCGGMHFIYLDRVHTYTADEMRDGIHLGVQNYFVKLAKWIIQCDPYNEGVSEDIYKSFRQGQIECTYKPFRGGPRY